MESNNDHLENNTTRLVRNSFDQQVRPDPDLREQMLHRLRKASGSYRRRIEFPDRALLSLTGVLLLAAVWLVLQVSSGQLILNSATLTVTAGILIINLLLVPVASVVIVIRSRHVKAS